MNLLPTITFLITISLLSSVTAEDKAEKQPRTSIDQAQFYWLLNRACWSGDDLGARMLLDAGADVDGIKDYKKFLDLGYGFEPSWPINHASWGGHKEVVILLLDRGAKVDIPEGEGYTALVIATTKGNFDLVKILLDAGADRSYKGPDGTALEVARAKKFNKIATLLTTKPIKTNKAQ